MSIGVPIKVLHEAEGHIVTCETNTGEVYRGKLIEAEDNMNCQMSNITVTYRDGRVAQLEQVYIRGSKIRFLILPDMLKNAPMLKSMKNKNQGSGAGRGKAAILKAQGMCSSCTGFNICVGPVSFRKGPCQFPGHRGGLGLQPSPHTATLQSWSPRCERLGALSCLLCLASPDHIHRAYAKSKVPP
ncbi:small nuclear ribonucleoprotein Sm D3 isoform X2 [Ursus arctos]|uniref:small nuclear ribonucleoprotein Sm D3 isoform X2 n=1 Tax=Ursus arctos TaxID=9644 RepID=UPI0025498550|nr:small nuclear ribonucleoprotein Sm D3 isoform X2 [Ursus arctos]